MIEVVNGWQLVDADTISFSDIGVRRPWLTTSVFSFTFVSLPLQLEVLGCDFPFEKRCRDNSHRSLSYFCYVDQYEMSSRVYQCNLSALLRVLSTDKHCRERNSSTYIHGEEISSLHRQIRGIHQHKKVL
jgi:hypothetical protein